MAKTEKQVEQSELLVTDAEVEAITETLADVASEGIPFAPLASSIYAKLLLVMSEVGAVTKQGKNTFQNYSYQKATDVAAAVRKSLAVHGLVPHMTITDRVDYEVIGPEKDGKPGKAMQGCHVTANIHFIDVDTGEQTESFQAYGSALDTGDKAIYKAQTGALKYVLRNAFLISDEADPEADTSVDEHMSGAKRRTKDEQKQFAEKKAADMKQQTDQVKTQRAEGRFIGPEKVKFFWATARKLGWEDVAVRDLIGRHGAEHTTEITNDTWPTILDDLDPEYKFHPIR